jgi:hypothetical protein
MTKFLVGWILGCTMAGFTALAITGDTAFSMGAVLSTTAFVVILVIGAVENWNR